MQEVTPAAVRSNLDLLCMSERRGVELASHVCDINRRSLFFCLCKYKITTIEYNVGFGSVAEKDDFWGKGAG